MPSAFLSSIPGWHSSASAATAQASILYSSGLFRRTRARIHGKQVKTDQGDRSGDRPQQCSGGHHCQPAGASPPLWSVHVLDHAVVETLAFIQVVFVAIICLQIAVSLAAGDLGLGSPDEDRP